MRNLFLRRNRRGPAWAAVVALLVAFSAGMVVPSHAYGSSTIYIEGRGFGHGRGLGQYGALGYALDHGWDWTGILNHFYGGTSAGNIGDVPMSIRLTRFDGSDTVVAQERGHMTTSAGGGTFAALRAIRVGSNSFRVEHSVSCGGPWHLLTASTPGPVWFSPQIRNDDRGEMLNVCEPDGTKRWLRGDVLAYDDAGSARTVNSVNNEGYLRGVVPRESPASWGDLGGGAGMHALRAQAVSARSYAASENRYAYAKTCDTTSCQVYGGRAVQDAGGYRDLEDARTDRAIGETFGVVRIKNGSVARTEFSSSTGGWTAGGTFPSVPDEGDDVGLNSNHLWRTSIAVSTVEATWPIGSLQEIVVTSRNGLGDWGGRVLEVRIQGSSRAEVVSGNTFRSRLGLKSDWFRIEPFAISSKPAASSWGSERLDLFARGADNNLIHKWTNDGNWSAWEGLGGYLTSGPAAVSSQWNRVEAFARGGDGAIWQQRWNGGAWTGWSSLGGNVTSPPAASTWGPGRFDVFARGADGGLWHRWSDGNGWSGWGSLGGYLNQGPGAVSWSPGRIDVFVVGGDNALWHRWSDGFNWSAWESLGGNLTSEPAVASWGPSRLDIFARGGDGATWWQSWNGTSWTGWSSLGGSTSDSPGAASPASGRIDVFVRGGDNAVWRRSFGSWGWSGWGSMAGP